MEIEVEENPDESNEEISDRSDRIVLVLKNGEKQPISNYWYSSGHHLVVRSLRYALGFKSWLHVDPAYAVLKNQSFMQNNNTTLNSIVSYADEVKAYQSE